LFAIKETAQAVSRKQKNVVEQNTAEGDSPNGILRNPKMPNRHFCANRVLSDDFFTPKTNRRCTGMYNGVL